MRTVLVDVGPIAHISGSGPLSGNGMLDENSLIAYDKGIIIEENQIIDIRESQELIDEYGQPGFKISDLSMLNSEGNNIISLEGRAVIPGLVDSHAHLVWGGDRSRELRWKLKGKSYSEIASMGGGIISTVTDTRKSSNEALFNISNNRLQEAFRSGTTHIESKSGYGLDVETELRILEVSKKLAEIKNMPTVDHTWLGAHAIPKDKTHKEYFESILSEQLPMVVEQGIARSADVFCEPGWFTLEETEDIMKDSRAKGLNLRLHIDEFVDGGGGGLAAELEVDTADHAHYTNDANREKMMAAGVNTGFLPGTPYSMGEEWPNFNSMIESEIVWSMASDFNPNNQILSLPFLASLLVNRCRVDPLAALVSATRNPAETTPHPSGLIHGRIEKSAVANLNILDSPHWESWCSKPSHTPFHSTIIEGTIVNHDL